MALQALATLAPLTSSHDMELTVTVDTEESAAVAVFHMDQDNYLLQQSQQVRPPPDLPDPSPIYNQPHPLSDRSRGGAASPGDCGGAGPGALSGRIEGTSGQLRLLVVNIHTVSV